MSSPRTPDDRSAVTEALAALEQGDRGASNVVFELVYDELRALAASMFRGSDPAATLQPTAVVHEVFVRLVGRDQPLNGREHFFALAARAMRQVLVDAARRKKTDKRGGGWKRVSLDPSTPLSSEDDDGAPTIDQLDAALSALEREDERRARVVELRYFGGLTVPEAARVLGVSERTVKSDWRFARAWLRAELARANA